MTGITEAAKSRTPLLVLAAEATGAAVATSTSTRTRSPPRSARCRAACTSPETRGGGRRRGAAHGRHGRRTVVLNLPLDVQAAELPADARRPRPPAPAAAAGARRDADVAGARRRCWRRRGGRCSSPGAARAHARRGRSEALADRCGALLATSRRRQRPVRRQPVVPRHLRRLRLAARRRADPRRRPRRRLGLRAEHVDHAPRPADRPGRAASSRSTSTPTRSAPTARSTSASSATSARRPRRVAASLRRRRPAGLPHARAGRADRRARCAGATCRTTTRATAGAHRPADAEHRARRPAAGRARASPSTPATSWATRAMYLVGARRARLLLHPGVPVDRPRAGDARSAPRWPSPTGCRWPRSATAAR